MCQSVLAIGANVGKKGQFVEYCKILNWMDPYRADDQTIAVSQYGTLSKRYYNDLIGLAI